MKPVKEQAIHEKAAYQKLCGALRRKRGGLTVSDMCASTALPLAQVKELIPRAADEYSARLKVTESGQIIYSFPDGFHSRYRGFAVSMGRFFDKFISILGAVSVFLFKIWIMVMLIGYFLLFMAIALGSVFISMYGNSRNSNRSRGNSFFGAGLFRLIWRLWFYSELTNAITGQNSRWYPGQGNRAKKQSRPLHRAIFSFVFGEGDALKDPDSLYKKTVIAYIQSRNGVISQPEFMFITGKSPGDAEAALLAFCSEFGGSPEATDDGTIVYRFDELLLHANTAPAYMIDPKTGRAGAAELSPPIRGLRVFSNNPKNMNKWFGIINAVNLFFGSYFMISALNVGALHLTSESRLHTLYEFVWGFLSYVTVNPLPIISIGLGLVPLVFSVLFWLIPALRSMHIKNENENIKFGNLRRLGYQYIWEHPAGLKENNIRSDIAECKPANIGKAGSRIVKEMGTYSMPDIDADEKGESIYTFKELAREKEALGKYRSSVQPEQLGKVVFDTNETLPAN
ncbi:MAG: hypothetical protein FWF29_03160 [Treponema sp.]|nr:hypothetical protein [Treponema sp.]